ncbi:hypothetical protein SAY87_025808 [Trapa incisa]|uniref:Uncharacterized protein n=1 Tax=Trapa incisa TaxID=236973 RepID=A0AAN7GID3_9MYRT|nr:hypothetical protein SAY87_025808 [Trapa incisa]
MAQLGFPGNTPATREVGLLTLQEATLTGNRIDDYFIGHVAYFAVHIRRVGFCPLRMERPSDLSNAAEELRMMMTAKS